MVAFAYEYAELGEQWAREREYTERFAEIVDRFWPGAAEAWSAIDKLNEPDS